MKMQLTRNFKIIFFSACIGLYISGVAYYYFEHFVRVTTEFGNDQSPYQALILHLHGMIGLLFLSLFGYLWATHIRPGLRGRVRKKSGLTMLFSVLILCLTVPGLYYLGDEKLRAVFSNVHTYLGLAVIVPFLVHYIKRARKIASAPLTEN